MDHLRLLNQVRSEENIKRAFHYAFYDRRNNDYYFDYFELEYVTKHKDKLIEEVLEELKDINSFYHRAAYAHYPNKSSLCYRRMIYITFKDLVVRYAFVIVLADLLDGDLSKTCFANRKANDNQAQDSLLENFAEVSWPNFCRWQKECAEQYKVLLRTDISSFYDSISHDYLIDVITRELSVIPETEFIRLFKKLLCFPVISYSHKTRITQQEKHLRQGLPIGNNTEGFLANLYLKDVDEEMQINGIAFGRYNDDIRIFANSREEVLRAVLILQEHLLTKGLNLNASKTRIAENKEEIEKLRSKSYDIFEYYIIENDINSENTQTNEGNELEKHIDQTFEKFDFEEFNPSNPIEEDKEAKLFCKFMSHEDLLPLRQRKPEHIEKLKDILIRWQGSNRHAAWLIVQSAFYNGISQDTQSKALEILFDVIKSDEAASYTKYRLLHHLVKLRGSKDKQFRFIERLKAVEIKELKLNIIKFLEQPAFELNLLSLYTFKVLGYSYSDLKKYAHEYVPKPLGEPIRNALLYASEPIHLSELPELATDYEPDERVEYY